MAIAAYPRRVEGSVRKEAGARKRQRAARAEREAEAEAARAAEVRRLKNLKKAEIQDKCAPRPSEHQHMYALLDGCEQLVSPASRT